MQVQLSKENLDRIEHVQKKHLVCGAISLTKLVNSVLASGLREELANDELSAAVEFEIKNLPQKSKC